MGIYINPTNQADPFDKVGLILSRAAKVTSEEFLAHVPGDKFGVCIVDNGAFAAAGVAFSQGEARAFAYPDGRRKTYCVMSLDAIRELDPSAAKALEGL